MSALAGKVAVVTGGSRGIGLAVAEALARDGASVVISGTSQSHLDAAMKALGTHGRRVSAVQADVRRYTDVETLMSTAVADFGGLDILINNAGVGVFKSVAETTVEEWHRVLDTNLTSAFLCSKAAYPAFKAAGGGKVINIGSMMSLFGAAFAPAYGSSKGGIVQLTRSMAVAWARDNIQVNAVLPGWIDTALTQNARKEVQGLHERVLSRTPAGRWGEPEDLAGIAVFLSSKASDFVTGTAIPVDGGYSSSG